GRAGRIGRGGADRQRARARGTRRPCGRAPDHARAATERRRHRPRWARGRRTLRARRRARRRALRAARLSLASRRVRRVGRPSPSAQVRGAPRGRARRARPPIPTRRRQRRGARRRGRPPRGVGVDAGNRGPEWSGRHRGLRRGSVVPAHAAPAEPPRASHRVARGPPRSPACGPDRVPWPGGREPGGPRPGTAEARRLAPLPRRPDATTAPRLAARAAGTSRRAPRSSRAAALRGGDVANVAELFLRHVCQTSPSPLGLTVARARGATIWDTGGRAYLDLLAGMGVANVGHTHPEVVAAMTAQAARHLHVMVYGELVQEA